MEAIRRVSETTVDVSVCCGMCDNNIIDVGLAIIVFVEVRTEEDEIFVGVSVGGWKYDLLEFGRWLDVAFTSQGSDGIDQLVVSADNVFIFAATE
jgi:hypothetical protein